MDTRAVIQPALDFIENNLRTDITAQELADRAGLSLYHYCRMFRAATGYPVARYIRRRKLLHAVYAMRCGLSGVQAALHYGFVTYSGFYRAYAREFGCTPYEAVRAGHANLPRRYDLYKEAYIPMTPETAARVLEHWGLSHLPLTEVFYESTGERNEHAVYVGKDYVLKVSADLSTLQTHIRLSLALQEQGLLAAVPLPTKQGETLVKHGDGWFFLSRRLPGSPLRASELLSGDAEHNARFCGEVAGQLHLALQSIECSVPQAAPLPEQLAAALPKLRAYLDLPESLCTTLKNTLAQYYPLLPQHIVHRDLNPSNILRSESGWSLIDFELSERNIRLYDPCYAATAVLSEVVLSGDASLFTRWLAFYHALLKGYDRIAHLTDAERAALPAVLLAQQLLCTAWFADQAQYAELFKANRRMTRLLIEHYDALQLTQ